MGGPNSTGTNLALSSPVLFTQPEKLKFNKPGARIMSATQDKSQKITFVHSNLYAIQSSKTSATLNAALPMIQKKAEASKKSIVLKAADLRKNSLEGIEVKGYIPTPIVGTPVRTVSSSSALKDLKENLKALNDLQARLRLMLEDIKESSEE